MSANRPYVISIAGFDPSAGAGILADVKCFEQHQVYGFGVCTALTVQSDTDFLKNEWLDAGQVIAQLEPLIQKFPVKAVKIGLIKDLESLQEVTSYLKTINPAIKIVLDPVLKATAGYKFHEWGDEPENFKNLLKQLNLITPNEPEMQELGGSLETNEICRSWATYCPVLLKGGHREINTGTDLLFVGDALHFLKPGTTEIHQKHGSGCVLSAAITANLALGFSLQESCRLAKLYIEQFLNSNTSLLGYHFS